MCDETTSLVVQLVYKLHIILILFAFGGDDDEADGIFGVFFGMGSDDAMVQENDESGSNGIEPMARRRNSLLLEKTRDRKSVVSSLGCTS